MKISIAHATRRPEQALEIRKLWLEAAAQPDRIEYIFGIDEDDPKSLALLANEPHTVSKAGGYGTRAFNDASSATTGEIIIGGCDDTHPIPRWDEVLIERFGDVSQPRVMLVGDGYRSDRLATLPIITRAWFNKWGWMFPPQFTTVGPDIWLSERAYRDGCMVDASDLVFEHRHPFYHKAPMDALYERQNAPERYVEAERILKELLEPLPISLCMIVGNEAQVIVRCLESAKGAFDELCLVRAIGDRPADETARLAKEWCAANGKGFRFDEYFNRTPNLQHIDNFAAARNLSFSIASKCWCLWLDADDLLDEPNCKRIRDASQTSRFDAHCFRYVMPNGAEYFRERLIKQGKGVWSGSVHETCSIEDLASNVKQVEIRHSPPHGKEMASANRNLSILEGSLRESPRDWFYYHEELLRVGRKPEAISAGLKAISIVPETMPMERYEICLNMAELEPAKTEHWAFEALKIDPLRREALSQLVQFSLHSGEVARAAQYFKWMDSIPLPNPKPWTHRAIWYGWARNYLRVMVLRAIGKQEQADKEHAEFMKDAAYSAGVGEHGEGK